MALADSDIKLKKSAAHSSDDTTATGGAKSATNITNAAPGEWFPRLKAKLTGTLDNAPDLSVQYQKVFIDNISATDDLLAGYVYIANGLSLPPSNGLVSFVSSSASDDSTVKAIMYGENVATSQIAADSVPLNGVTEVSGAITFARGFRVKVCSVATGALVALVGTLTIKINGNIIGTIPPGYSFATMEVRLWVPATTDDTGTSSNRRTAPGGSTFSLAVSVATAIPFRNNSGDNDLLHLTAQGVWGECKLQPGSPPFNGVQVLLAAKGDGT